MVGRRSMRVMRLPTVVVAFAISQALAFGRGQHAGLSCSFGGGFGAMGFASPFALGFG